MTTKIEALRKRINDLNYQYHVLDCSPVTDAEYDALYLELVELEKGTVPDPGSPTQRIGAEGKAGFKKVKHAQKMLSLDNMRSAADVISYLGESTLVLEPKVDGVSLKLVYEGGKLVQAITRGNGSEGDDVTASARAIKTIPLQLTACVDIVVVGEVYMTLSEFESLNRQLEVDGIELMANPRNTAAGAIKLKNPKEVAARNLSFVAYGSHTEIKDIPTQAALTDYLEFLGFQSVYMLPTTQSCQSVADCFSFETELDLAAKIAEADLTRKFLDLATDGLVFKINDLSRQRELGEGTKYPKYACAYKFPPERKSTRLLGVTVQIGRTGKVTPVAELEPVSLGGTIVRRASLCNQEEIRRLNVNVGDTVLIEKSAEIIPKIVGLSQKSAQDFYLLPEMCPCCDKPLKRPDGFVDTYCSNRECPDQIMARLKHSCGKSALDLDGCGEALIKELMRHGARTLSDVLTIDPIFLKAAARRRFEHARKACVNQPLWRKLHALGIEGFGQTLCQEIASEWSSLTEAASPAHLGAFSDLVGDAALNNMCDYFELHTGEYDALDKLIGLSATSRVNGPLKGKSFCITGDLISGSRGDVSKRIEEAGGTVKSCVSRRLNYLIQGTETGRVKRAAAERHGVPIITERQLYGMLGVSMPVSRSADADVEY